MAERRFNEFRIDEDYYASFEEAVGRVEDIVLPAYEALVERQRLTGDADETQMLGLFVAFQLLRTRSYRDGIESIFSQLREHTEQWGIDLDGLERYTEDDFKQLHLKALRNSI